MIDSVQSLSTPVVPSKTAKSHDVAGQFEALLIGQLLKSAREGNGGWLGTGEEDSAGQTGVEVAEQEFARMLAQKGGLGLSATIEKAMRR